MSNLFQMTAVEMVIRETDRESGAQIYQITSCPAINNHEYFEVPYMDAASRYVMFTRRMNSVGPVQLWRADLERNLVTYVSETQGNMRGHAVSPCHRYFYYTDLRDGLTYELVRVDMNSLEMDRWSFDDGQFTPRTRGSVTPDLRFYINSAYLGHKRYGIWRFDFNTGSRDLIWEQGHDMCNAHPQIDPGGTDIMIQHNRGSVVDDDGRMLVPFGDIGKTIYLIDINGRNRRNLPWGKPYTRPTQGHQSWIGKTHGILSTVGDRNVSRGQIKGEGNLLALMPGDETPRVITKGYYFSHANASRDGRFYVSDETEGGRLVVGSLSTGKSRVLCETGTSFSRPQYTHPHPYFSPDNRWVIYNSDRTGIPHVYGALVPEGLLEELEQD